MVCHYTGRHSHVINIVLEVEHVLETKIIPVMSILLSILVTGGLERKIHICKNLYTESRNVFSCTAMYFQKLTGLNNLFSERMSISG
jgi:hypothetical protein